MKSIKVCEYSRSRSFHDNLILHDQLQVSVLRTNGPLVLHCITISVTSGGSDKLVCHGAAKVCYGYPRSIMIISTFYYGLLRSYAVSFISTKA